ncbi:alpha/beta hydrolase, partial [Escherichia fergusonii]|uniref:T6SS effector phospholipase Tle3 domain-containing protein n=1 Tax=Escherichia fergusonii TaxID=564 RepID=UPI001CBFF80F
EIYASPPRAYFVHAAHRLKELIKAIRDKQRDCPITVVCHSQGNMVTMAAALLGEREAALADTYVLCNPPYSLEALLMDEL